MINRLAWGLIKRAPERYTAATEIKVAFNAKVVQVFIASPSDVVVEREAVRDELHHWNAVNTRTQGLVFLPLGWELDASPDLSNRPQQLINERLLDHCDIVVGILGSRIGSPTGLAASGTVEEIRRHHDAGKTVMLYFSDEPVAPSMLDAAQHKAVQDFKKWARSQGIIWEYKTKEEFRDIFRKQFPITLQNNSYLKIILNKSESFSNSNAEDKQNLLSSDEMGLLNAAVADRNGMVAIRSSLNATSIGSNDTKFADGNNLRELERWRAAVQSLEAKGYLRDTNQDGVLFSVTHKGYAATESAPDAPSKPAPPSPDYAAWVGGCGASG